MAVGVLLSSVAVPTALAQGVDRRPGSTDQRFDPDRGSDAGDDDDLSADDGAERGGRNRAPDDRYGRPVEGPDDAPSPGDARRAGADDRAEADNSDDPVDRFYEVLARDGRWIQHPRYGLVWYPFDVDEEWRPYTLGRWVLTEEHGWLWESEEPWGWAVYHYGRWGFDDDYGWFWVPGDEWAPAWVDWRSGEGHIGWAPLPPEVRWRNGAFDYGDVDLGSSRFRGRWSFVPEASFAAASLYTFLVPRRSNVQYLRRSQRVTDYRRVDRRIVNGSINVGRIERAARRPIPPVRIIEAPRPVDVAPRDRRFEGRRDGRGGPPSASPGGPVAGAPIAVFRPFDRGVRRQGVDPTALPPRTGRPDRGPRDGQPRDGQPREGRPADGAPRERGQRGPRPDAATATPAPGAPLPPLPPVPPGRSSGAPAATSPTGQPPASAGAPPVTPPAAGERPRGTDPGVTGLAVTVRGVMDLVAIAHPPPVRRPRHLLQARLQHRRCRPR